MKNKYILEFRSYPLWLKILLPAAGVIFLVALLSQMILFPDNPIYLKDGRYVGKYGATHSPEAFAMFVLLNRTILVSGLALFGGFICSVIYGSGTASRLEEKPPAGSNSERD